MKTLYLNLIVLLLILSGCKPHKTVHANSLFLHSDVGEITTLAFDSVMPPENVIKTHLPRVFFNENEKSAMTDYKEKLDTTILTVFIADTLIRLPSAYLQRIFNDHGPTDNINSWASEIIIDEEPGFFKMENIRFDYNYLYRLQSNYKKKDDNKYIAGLIEMSRVCFNKDKTKAFVYVKRHGGPVITLAYHLYFEKRNGKWLLIKKDLAWVS